MKRAAALLREAMEARRLLGLAERLRTERRGKPNGLDAFFLLGCALLPVAGWCLGDGGSGRVWGNLVPTAYALHFLLDARRLQWRPMSEWEALRMPSRRGWFIGGLLLRLPWLLVLGASWTAYVALRLIPAGGVPPPAMLAIGALLLPAPLVWHAFDRRLQVAGYTALGLFLLLALLSGSGPASHALLPEGVPDGLAYASGPALLALGLGAVVAWHMRGTTAGTPGGLLGAVDWRRVPRKAMAFTRMSVLFSAWTTAVLAMAAGRSGVVSRVCTDHAGALAIAALAVVIGVVPWLVLSGARRAERAAGEALIATADHGVGEGRTANGASSGLPYRLLREPFRHGGGLAAAADLLRRSGDRIGGIPIRQMARPLLRTIGPGLAFTAVAMAHRWEWTAAWVPMLAAFLSPNVGKHEVSEHAYLLGMDLREQHLHNLRSYARHAVAPVLLAALFAYALSPSSASATAAMHVGIGVLLRTGLQSTWRIAWDVYGGIGCLWHVAALLLATALLVFVPPIPFTLLEALRHHPAWCALATGAFALAALALRLRTLDEPSLRARMRGEQAPDPPTTGSAAA